MKKNFVVFLIKIFLSWKKFNETSNLIRTDNEPNNSFYVSLETKKRNTIPLIHTASGDKRIIEITI